MKQQPFFLLVIFTLALILSLWRVSVWWMNVQTHTYPERGDFDYYVKACNHIPLDHPLIPGMLHTLNLIVQNPSLTVLYMIILGYTTVFFSVYILSYLRNCHPIGCFSAFILVGASASFLSPTALKNIWTLAFLLLSLIFLSMIGKASWKTQIITVFFFALTFLSHTIAIVTLLPILLCYVTWSIRHKIGGYTKFLAFSFAAIFLLIVVGATTPYLFSLFKLNIIIDDFLANPINVIVDNLRYNVLVLSHPEVYVHSTIYLGSVLVGGGYFIYTRKFDPMFTGLLLAYSLLFFFGSTPFAERLRSTGTALLAVLFAHTLTISFKGFTNLGRILHYDS